MQIGIPHPGEAVLSVLRTLVVDDNTTNRRILHQMLTRCGLRPTEASDGVEALACLTRAQQDGEPIQLLLTDLHMPIMDGVTLIERIRKMPGLPMPVILVMTSDARAMDLKRIRDLGVSLCLSKPVRRRELLLAIRRAMGTEEMPATEIISDEPAAIPRRSLRILVAEDNRVNQIVVTRIIEHLGHSAVIAANGREALALCAAQPFDLVLMDVQMPEMDGFTATAQIREAEQRTGGHLLILAVTAHALQGDRERCLAAGMDGYITKPITATQLAEAIRGFFPGESVGTRKSHAHSAPPRPAAAWDPDRTLACLDGDEALLAEVVEVFLDEAPRRLETMRRAIDLGDCATAAETAHSLKGQLGYFGVAEISSRARRLEDFACAADLPSVAREFPEFSAAIEALLQTMQAVKSAGMNCTELRLAHVETRQPAVGS